jgi:hypothetical protein
MENELNILKQNTYCYRLKDGSLIIAEEVTYDPEQECYMTGIQVEIVGNEEGVEFRPYSIPNSGDTLVELYYHGLINRFKPEDHLVDYYVAFIMQEAVDDAYEDWDEPDDDFNYRYN